MTTTPAPEPAPLPPGAAPAPAPHPRDAEMEEAARDLLTFLKPWVDRHKLSAVEYVYLLSVPAYRQIQHLCVLERETRPVRRVGDPE